MRAIKEALKALLDSITQELDWLQGVLPSVLQPVLGPLRDIRDGLQQCYDWIVNGGDADELAQAAIIWQAYGATVTHLTASDITSASLNALAAPTRWTDPNAPENYAESFSQLPDAFGYLADYAQAIASGLNADADKINEFYDGMNQDLLALLGTAFSLSGAVIGVITAAAEFAATVEVPGVDAVTALQLAGAIMQAISALISVIQDYYQLLLLLQMQAPGISPTADGQAWPTPTLW